ncbi:MAG: ArsR family transcriptional regulator [Oxalobacteraceae bacterium]|nr:ArsR family transcriptional regulator [Oxalobacteraceae bacterium]
MQNMPVDALEDIAAYFQVLAEPSRLQLLNLLRQGECNVTELAERTGLSLANVSRHLALMSQHGLVSRQSRGVSTYYKVADSGVYKLCDLVCGNIARDLKRSAGRRALFIGQSKI